MGAPLDPVRRADPVRVAEMPAAAGAGLAGGAVGQVLVLGGGALPAAPAAREAPRAELDGARPLPVEADEVEALRRDGAGGRARHADGQLLGPDRRPGGPGCGGCQEE